MLFLLVPAHFILDSGDATLSLEGNRLAIQNLSTDQIDVYQFPTLRPLISINHGSQREIKQFVCQMAFAKGTKMVVCSSSKSEVFVVEVATGECNQVLEVENGDYSVCLLTAQLTLS